MPQRLQEGSHLTRDELIDLARDLFTEAGDRQEDVAAAIGYQQSQVSRALQGERRYVKTCIAMIEHYTGFKIKYPVGHVRKEDDSS